MQKIVLTGGGTAGHVMPNLALIPELRRNGWGIYYIGSQTGIEKELHYIHRMEESKLRDAVAEVMQLIGNFASGNDE